MSYPESAYGGPGQGASSTVAEVDSPPNEGTFSVVDRYSSFDGTFTADRDLRIDGIVKGTIECKGTLLVAEGATVNATVDAENIAIAGELTGEIRCMGRLQLLPTGRLSGAVSTSSLVISEGAIYDGDLTMDESPRQSNGAQPAVGTAQASPEVEATPAEASSDAVESNDEKAEEAEAVPTTFIRRLGGSETPWNADERSEQTDDTSAREES